MRVDIVAARGLGNNVLKSGNREALERQSQADHDALLDISTLPAYGEYLAAPANLKPILLAALEAQARAREADYVKWWEDQEPRVPVSQSSSWVGGANYDPYSQNLTLKEGNRYKSYAGISPERFAQILNSNSIGEEVHNL
jgi:hypothetical protein